MEEFFDNFAKGLKPFEIEFVDMDLFPNNVLGGIPSGVMSLRVKETPDLLNAQKKLNEELYKKFGPCPADHDDDYIFHMTFAIGGADFESYQKAYDVLKKWIIRGNLCLINWVYSIMMMTISFPEHISVIRSAIFDALIVIDFTS